MYRPTPHESKGLRRMSKNFIYPKILIEAPPRTGKTYVLKQVWDKTAKSSILKKYGIIVEEITDGNIVHENKRIGFKAVNLDNDDWRILAHIHSPPLFSLDLGCMARHSIPIPSGLRAELLGKSDRHNIQLPPSTTVRLIDEWIINDAEKELTYVVREYGEELHFSPCVISNSTGRKYIVRIENIDDFIVPVLEKSISEEDAVLVFDEIGRMQAFSERFLEKVSELFEGNHLLLATIVRDPEPWSLKFKRHERVIRIEVTRNKSDDLNESNAFGQLPQRELICCLSKIFNAYTEGPSEVRKKLEAPLEKVFRNPSKKYYDKLSKKQQQYVDEMVKDYIDAGKYLLIRKLFSNAVQYVAKGEVNGNKGEYTISGRSGEERKITHKEGNYKCTCQLFNGRESWYKAGDCSHIQSVKIYRVGLGQKI